MDPDLTCFHDTLLYHIETGTTFRFTHGTMFAPVWYTYITINNTNIVLQKKSLILAKRWQTFTSHSKCHFDTVTHIFTVPIFVTSTKCSSRLMHLKRSTQNANTIESISRNASQQQDCMIQNLDSRRFKWKRWQWLNIVLSLLLHASTGATYTPEIWHLGRNS